MRLFIAPGGRFVGQLTLPGDKSISHRAAIMASIAEGDCHIHNFLFAGVTEVMLRAIRQLGIRFERDGNILIVHGKGLHGLIPPESPIDCGNSATTLRLLTGLLAAAGIPAILDGSEGLRRRPMKRIVEPLRMMGVPIQASQNGTAPVILGKRPVNQKLMALDYNLPVASAQVKSALLLVSLAAEGACVFHEPGPARDHTELLMNRLGISVNCYSSNSIHIVPPDSLIIPSFDLTIPGDISSAAFLISGAMISPGSHLELLNVGLNPTRTGFLDALWRMGANLQITAKSPQDFEQVGDLIAEPSDLHGIDIGGELVVRMIDEFPAFVSTAIFSEGNSTVSDALELRSKESDRITALVHEFSVLGAHINERSDGFKVLGKSRISGGNCQSHGDHRLAMALAISGLSSKTPVIVDQSEVISESYPDFINDLQKLGASVSEMDV